MSKTVAMASTDHLPGWVIFSFLRPRWLGETRTVHYGNEFRHKLEIGLPGLGWEKFQFRFRPASLKDWIFRNMISKKASGRIFAGNISLADGGTGIFMLCW